MFAEIGKFFEKTVVNPIRELTDKDFALRHETARLRKLEETYASVRPVFFQAKEQFSMAVSAYEHASEDFSKRHGRVAFGAIAGAKPPGIAKPVKPDGALGVLTDIGNTGRDILKVVSFGLTEAIFNIEDVPRERKRLHQQINRLDRAIKALTSGTRQLQEAKTQYDAATQAIKEEHARLGDDITASDVHVMTARAKAQREIIEALVEQKLSKAQIAEVTGIKLETITEVLQNPTPNPQT